MERKKEEMHQAEKSGDPIKAAQILTEIIALDKRRKQQ